MPKPAVLFFVSIAFTLLSATSSSAQPLTGRVVDPSGDPVPRAYVRVLDAGGKTTAGSFTEADGRFRLESTTPNCRVEVLLAGFESAGDDHGGGRDGAGARGHLPVAANG
jgi:polyisoprenoid-binding protein YceI